MNTNANTKRILSWAVFIIIIALIVWGLIAAQNKAAREGQAILLPSDIATSTDHIRGSSIAPVTLVEYGDFECPACGAYHPLVEQVIAAEGPDALRFVFRNFPLSQHVNAVPGAQAAEAAGLQGKYWEMYNMLYEKQADWVNSTDPKSIFTDYAKSMGLDTAKFSTDYDSQAVKDKINNDYKGGANAGINSTPTFFINGTQITNPQSYDDFKKLIDDSVPKLNL